MTEGKAHRGFATMTLEARQAIASKGGKTAHATGTAHEFDTLEAREAGRKGGLAVSQNREHMARIGRAGGKARAAHKRERELNAIDAGVRAP